MNFISLNYWHWHKWGKNCFKLPHLTRHAIANALHWESFARSILAPKVIGVVAIAFFPPLFFRFFFGGSFGGSRTKHNAFSCCTFSSTKSTTWCENPTLTLEQKKLKLSHGSGNQLANSSDKATKWLLLGLPGSWAAPSWSLFCPSTEAQRGEKQSFFSPISPAKTNQHGISAMSHVHQPLLALRLVRHTTTHCRMRKVLGNSAALLVHFQPWGMRSFLHRRAPSWSGYSTPVPTLHCKTSLVASILASRYMV